MPQSTTRGATLLASRFAVLPLIVGGCYALLDPVRFSSPAFNSGKAIAPMQTWGVVSILGGLVLLGAFVYRHATGAVLPLAAAYILGGAFYFFWAFVLFVNAVKTPTASPTGALFVAFVSLSYFVAAAQTARRVNGW